MEPQTMTAASTTPKPSDQPFKWTCRSGEEIEIPSASKLDPDIDSIMEYEANPTKLTSTMRLLQASIDPQASKVIGMMKASEFNDFITAWGEHSGITLGESFLS